MERDPDFLKIAQIAHSDEKFIIRIEYQTNNDPSMAMRMLLYYALLRNAHKMPAKQYVIYLSAVKMRQCPHNWMEVAYNSIICLSIYRISTMKLSLLPQHPKRLFCLSSATLAKKTPQKIGERIYQRLEQLVPEKLPLQGYMRQLSIFAILRQLQKEIYQKITDMPILIDYTLDPFFPKGFHLNHEEAQAVIAWKNKSL